MCRDSEVQSSVTCMNLDAAPLVGVSCLFHALYFVVLNVVSRVSTDNWSRQSRTAKSIESVGNP